MSNMLLQPGLASKYTSEAFTASSTTGADTLECSQCRQLAIQISSESSPTGNIDIQQTFNGSDWVAFVSNIAVTDGTVALVDEADGPFGRIRIDATDLTAGTVTVTIAGFK